MTSKASSIPTEFYANLKFRRELLSKAAKNKAVQQAIIKQCQTDIIFFLNAFCWCFEPRKRTLNGIVLPNKVPFITWEHQVPVIQQLFDNLGVRDITIEKSRGEGASWIGTLMAVHSFVFVEGSTVGLISKDEDAADDPDNPDSLGWKIDRQLEWLPNWMIGEKDKDYKRDRNHHAWKNFKHGATINAYAATANVATGGRKAQPLDAKVLTPDGWSTMGSMAPGCEVIGANGERTEVVSVHPQGEVEIFEVQFDDGSKTECCGDHLWSVETGFDSLNNRKKSVKTLSDIAEDYQKKRYRVPIAKPVKFNEVSLPVEPYLLGSLLGDGCMAAKTGQVTFTTADQESLLAIEGLLPEGLRLMLGSPLEWRIASPNRGQGVNPLSKALRRLGLTGTKSHTKFIPEIYLRGSVAQRTALLKGLMDTDGSVVVRERKSRSCEVSYVSVSKSLAEGVRDLVWSLGGSARIKSYTSSDGRRDRYTVRIRTPFNPFQLTRKAARWIPPNRYAPTRIIASIKPIGKKPAQCITVSAKDSLYVTDDYIVTHNSWMLMDEFAKFPKPQDYAAMASTQPVTDCRIFISTPWGASGAFYDVVKGDHNALPLILDWKTNPTRNRGLYRMVAGTPVALDPVNNPLPPDYTPPSPQVLALFSRLRAKGFILEDRDRSPWYDRECDRPGATPQLVAQEYDRDYGGSSFRCFDETFTKVIAETIVEPTMVGDIDYSMDNLEDVHFERRLGGPLTLWMPLDFAGNPPTGRYVLGCDVSNGLGGTFTSHSTIIGFDANNEQVLEFASRNIEPQDFADYCIALAKWLGDAYLCWEANGPGQAYSARVRKRGYGNIMRRKVKSRSGRRDVADIGWWTLEDNKRIMFADMRQAGKNKSVTIRSRELMKEFGNYVYRDGKIYHSLMADAQDDSKGVSHGDRVIGACIAYQGLQQFPSERLDAKATPETAPPGTFASRHFEYEQASKASDEQW